MVRKSGVIKLKIVIVAKLIKYKRNKTLWDTVLLEI